MRKMFAGCGVGLCCLLTLLPVHAQEVATLVLRDGQRPSGELVDLNASGFILRISGQDRAFPAGEVVVVDFAGGGPPGEGQSRIAAGQSFIVMKSGQIIDGRLTDIGGTHPLRVTIDTNGGTRDFTSNDVAQVYLYGGSRAGAVAEAAPLPDAIVVQANQPWTNSGITVKKGERLTFLTAGHIMIAANASSAAGGSPAVTSPQARYPLPGTPVGALIGRIDKGAPFAIGGNTQPIAMTKKGRLYLGVNDDYFADNTGAFSVSIRR